MENNGWGGKRNNQTGRPKGTFKEIKKSESIYVRVTAEEKAKIQELAKTSGLSVSQYILKKIFN